MHARGFMFVISVDRADATEPFDLHGSVSLLPCVSAHSRAIPAPAHNELKLTHPYLGTPHSWWLSLVWGILCKRKTGNGLVGLLKLDGILWFFYLEKWLCISLTSSQDIIGVPIDCGL
jgi:hypothetical protein